MYLSISIYLAHKKQMKNKNPFTFCTLLYCLEVKYFCIINFFFQFIVCEFHHVRGKGKVCTSHQLSPLMHSVFIYHTYPHSCFPWFLCWSCWIDVGWPFSLLSSLPLRRHCTTLSIYSVAYCIHLSQARLNSYWLSHNLFGWIVKYPSTHWFLLE